METTNPSIFKKLKTCDIFRKDASITIRKEGCDKVVAHFKCPVSVNRITGDTSTVLSCKCVRSFMF